MANTPKGPDPKKFLGNILKVDSQEVNFDLDNWIKDFEDGFPKYVKINQELQQHYWGQTFVRRPQVKELNFEADAQQNEGYRVVELFPDRNNKDESYLLFGTPLELMTQVSMMMNMHRMLTSRDMGAFLGWPVDEYLRAKPRQDITVQLFLTNLKAPPYYKRASQWYTERQVTIPLVDRRKLTYKAFRDACGGAAGQAWGEWTARAYLALENDQAGIHQMVAGGDTEEKAKKNLEKFLYFTRAKLKGLTTHKIDYSKGTRATDPNRSRYNSFKVYPAWATVLNTKLVALDDKRNDGKKTLSGKMLTKENKLWLFMEREPSWWATRINNLTSPNFSRQ